MAENILKVENLSVSFNNHQILSGVCFEVPRDNTVAVVGTNGSGKTVLFKSLLNLIQYSGKVEWANDAKIGYVPQKLSISRDLPITVLEFLKLKEKDDKKIKEVLESVGFKEKAAHI